MVCADARPPEQWIYHWNVILLPDLLIFLNRLACNIDAEFLTDIFINIGEHNGRVDLAAAEFRELL